MDSSEKSTISTLTERRYFTSSPVFHFHDATTFSAMSMDISGCSSVSNPTERGRRGRDSRMNGDGFMSNLSFVSSVEGETAIGEELETTCTLKRLLAKYRHGRDPNLPDNAKYLLYLLENVLEESQNANQEMQHKLDRRNEDILEMNKSASERQEALIQEHRKRVSMIVKDHEGHLTASIERAINARRQTASLQTQLALALSKLTTLEEKHQKEHDATRLEYDVKIDALREQLQTMKKEVNDKEHASSIEKKTVTSSRSMALSPIPTNGQEQSDHSDNSDASNPVPVHRDIVGHEKYFSNLRKSVGERQGEFESLQKKLDQVNADIVVKVEEVNRSSDKLSVLRSKLDFLDGEIDTVTGKAMKREETWIALQQKLEERQRQLRSLSKKIDSEKRRSVELTIRSQLTKEQEEAALEKMKSLEKARDDLSNQCDIRSNQVKTLSDLLSSRGKILHHLEKELRCTDSELSKLFEEASSEYTPRSTNSRVTNRQRSVSRKWNVRDGGGRSSADFGSRDMSLDSSLASCAPILTYPVDGSNNFQSFGRRSWTNNKERFSFDTDSGVSSTFLSRNFDQEIDNTYK